MSMSDRIMVLRDGKVQQVGTPTDLYLHPANPFVASFIGAREHVSRRSSESRDGCRHDHGTPGRKYVGRE